MTRSGALKLALLVLVILFAALPAGASALVAKSATFEATLRGSQLETSSVPGDPYGCPAVQTKENVEFETPAPELIEIDYLGSEMFVFGHVPGTRGLWASANIYTTGTVAREKNAVSCADADDRDKPLGCGTRQFSRWRLKFQASGPNPHRNLELLDNNPERTDPFDNCTPFRVHFPAVLWSGQHPTWVLARVSKTEILDPQRRTIVLSADGTVSDRGENGGSFSNSLSWTLTLHRVDDDELRFKAQSSSPITVGHRGGFTGTFFPPGATASSYTWQMKRSHQSHWTTLGRTPTRPFHWTFRLAGHFQYRTIVHGARSPAGGPPQTIITRARRLEVRFPTRDQILADQDVNTYTQEAWTLTLGNTTQAWRQEFGFWIFLDTCHVPRGHRRYHRTRPMIEGPRADAYHDAEIHFGPRPADDPNPPPAVIGCATYTVARFHTHTPTTYRLPPGGSRLVGPSPRDRRNAGQIPGFVFDYIADPPEGNHIPYGHPMEKPAQVDGYGESRRPTPQR